MTENETDDGAEDILKDRVNKHDLAALEEAKGDAIRVVDHQINIINDVDDKASDTLRSCILLLSVILTAGSLLTSIGGLDIVAELPVLLNFILAGILICGILCIFITTHKAIVVYRSTEMAVGPKHLLDQFEENNYTQKEWLYLVLYNTRQKWIPKNEKVNKRDAERLDNAHRYLQYGLVLIFAAVLLYLLAITSYTAAEEIHNVTG